MILAYERDPYCRRLEVRVLSAGRQAGSPFALLDDTILYPEGGGQPSDRGRLAGVEVLGVKRVEGELRHLLAAPVDPGSATLELDWQRRFDHMQQHTAQHLLSALALARFGWATRAFHLGPDRADIELDVASPPAELLDRLEEEVVRAIRAARSVTARRVPPEIVARLEVRSRGLPAGHRGTVRLVEIEGLDRNTCGGTHVRSTAEIETVKILAVEPLRGGSRLTWLAGGRVRRHLAERRRLVDRLRRLFDTSADALVEVASQKLDGLVQAQRRIRRLEQRLAEQSAVGLAAAADPFVDRHFDDASGGFLHQVARSFVELAPAGVALLTGSSEGGDCFALAAGESSVLDLTEAGDVVCDLLQGRGGGSGRVFQGRAGDLERRAEAAAELRRLISETIV